MHTFVPDAYVYASHETMVVQLVSHAARSIPGLTPDADGLLRFPMSAFETVFEALDRAGIDARMLGGPCGLRV